MKFSLDNKTHSQLYGFSVGYIHFFYFQNVYNISEY